MTVDWQAMTCPQDSPYLSTCFPNPVWQIHHMEDYSAFAHPNMSALWAGLFYSNNPSSKSFDVLRSPSPNPYFFFLPRSKVTLQSVSDCSVTTNHFPSTTSIASFSAYKTWFIYVVNVQSSVKRMFSNKQPQEIKQNVAHLALVSTTDIICGWQFLSTKNFGFLLCLW